MLDIKWNGVDYTGTDSVPHERNEYPCCCLNCDPPEGTRKGNVRPFETGDKHD